MERSVNYEIIAKVNQPNSPVSLAERLFAAGELGENQTEYLSTMQLQKDTESAIKKNKLIYALSDSTLQSRSIEIFKL